MMPELPEVETLCRQLNAILPGREILNVEILDPCLGKMEALAGRRVAAVTRRGKFIEIDLDGGLKAVLHLRMTGRLLWQGAGAPLPPHSRLVVSFPRGRLVQIDPRRFAIFFVRPEKVPRA
ncbi:MAG: DNA-formamidopyrimidine glycosylase family protein, partial [Thermodesulfobacteriota bacterium]